MTLKQHDSYELPQAPALDNDEYTVGWVTALALERAAAEAMLDVEHDELQWQHEKDDNVYTLGSIRGHNVVIASLPETYGPTAAATAASQMLSTFKSIRIGLMVGIGGGIPNLESGHDIRLGDIVVSTPSGTFGGVKQYDFGKTTAGGVFEPEGYLKPPPRVLLNAVNKIKTKHIRKPSDVPEILREMEKNNPFMVEPHQGGPSYLYQGSDNDRLFQTRYRHKEGAKTCDECDQEQQVKRSLRKSQDPFIYYGTIASGNQVIKDAETRDILGKDCLCFEMEAAGLMNDFPCLVIRGICDYADSHKNKRWQNYAAATAAAYAKELLRATPVRGVKELPKAAAVMNKLQEIDVKLVQLARDFEAHHSQELLNWLSPFEPSKRHYDIRSSRLPNSGIWAIRHNNFLNWLSDSPTSPILCCYGDPGAGKTFISSLVIDELEKIRSKYSQYSHSEGDKKSKKRKRDTELTEADVQSVEKSVVNIGLAYIYCDYRDQTQQTTQNIYGTILKQLLRALPSIPEELTEILLKSHREKIPPELGQLRDILRITSKFFDQIYICLDALDECEHVDQLLSSLKQIPSSIRLFSTGRKHVKSIVQRYFEDTQTILIEAKESDIRILIQEKVNEDRMKDPEIMDAKLEQDIIEKISALSMGIFLLPVLHIDTVLEALSIRERREALQTLPPNLDEAFGKTMERIQTQPKAWVKQATKILTWIHLAERPLSIDELLEACAIKEGDSDLDLDNFPSRGTFLNCCLGLAIVENETSTVRLVHFSLQEYLTKEVQILGRPIEEGHENMARACLTYIMFRSVTEMVSEKSFEENKVGTSTPSHALFKYAACQWGHHVRKSGCLRGTAIQLAHKYLYMGLDRPMKSHSCLRSSFRVLGRSAGSFSVVHIGAYFGIHIVLSELVKQDDVMADSKDDLDGQTPLSLAARYGHEAVVKLLVRRDDVKADSKDNSGRTPLSWAAKNGHEAVVKLLVGRDDVKADSKDSRGQTPLSWAAENGHEAVVKLLVGRDDVQADSRGDEYGQTPLSLAAKNGHEAVVKLLVGRDDVQADSKDDKYGQTPLSLAAENGHEAIVKLLVGRDDVKVDSEDYGGQTPLSLAAENGHEAVVKLLVGRDDVKADSKDNKYGKTPLSWAARNGREAVVKLLVGRDDVKADSKDNGGQTPLLWAARNGREAVVKLLVGRDDVMADSKDNGYGRTPLLWAAKNGHEAVVKLLVGRDDVKADSKDDKYGQTPLSWAAENGHEAIVKLLVGRDDVKADSKDNYGNTPLSLAETNGHEAVVKLLKFHSAHF